MFIVVGHQKLKIKLQLIFFFVLVQNFVIMSEVDLSAMADTEKDRAEEKSQTPLQEINNCLKACGFGWFNVRFMATTLLGLVAGVSVSNTTAFLLPSAECDLQMTLLQKGLLNAIPYLGMLFSSVVAGFLTDTFGRKIFLQLGYGGIFASTIVAGSSQTYAVLVTAKFFDGMLFATGFSATLTLTAELCHNDIRDRILILQSSFVALSQVIIAAVSWAVLTRDWNYTFFDGYIVLHSWNFYLFIMSIWSLSAFSGYSFLPESPKYLVAQKRYSEARQILINIYKENTGKSEDTYPYRDIWKDKITDDEGNNTSTSISHQIVVSLHNIKPMFRKPLVGYLILICLMTFMTMSLHNIIRLWFPQVSTVVEHYNNGDRDLCQMLDEYTLDLRKRVLNTTIAECIPTRSGAETYINSIIIGSVCLLPFLVTGLLVNKIGKKPLIIFAVTICTCATFAMRYANSKTAVVALFAIDISVGQTTMSLNQAIVVQFFPTASRTLAISMIMMIGRIGTLFGNIAFPVLLDMGCNIPFYSLSGLMLCVIVMAFFLPTQKP